VTPKETQTAPSAGPDGEKRSSPPDSKEPAPAPEPNHDTRTMGQMFKDEPMLQKALDMFDGEVLP
jgi:hypothetical protein